MANRSFARGEPTIEDVFRYEAIVHLAHMPEPIQSVFLQQHVPGWEASMLKDLCIWYFLSPVYAKDAPQAAEMEAIELPLVFGICCPCYTAIEECMIRAWYTATFVVTISLGFFQTRPASRQSS